MVGRGGATRCPAAPGTLVLLVVSIGLGAVPERIGAQTIRGIVLDAGSSAPVEGALVRDRRGAREVRSGPDGAFSIPTTSTLLWVAAEGYVPQEVRAPDDSDLLLVELTPAIGLAAIEVEVDRPTARARLAETVFLEGPADLLGGITADPVAALALRGARPAGDLSALLVQRGGAPDEVAYQWERIRLWGPTHVMGLFSVFNPLATSEVQLLRTDMPGSVESTTGGVVAGYAPEVGRQPSVRASVTTLDVGGSVSTRLGNASVFLAGRRGLDDAAVGQALQGAATQSFWDAQLATRYDAGVWSVDLSGFSSRDEATFDGTQYGDYLETDWTNRGGAAVVRRTVTDRLSLSLAADRSMYDASIRTSDRSTPEGASRNEVQSASGSAEVLWTPSDEWQLAFGVGVRRERASLSGDTVGSYFTGQDSSVRTARFVTAGVSYGGSEWEGDVGIRVERYGAATRYLPRAVLLRRMSSTVRVGLSAWRGLQQLSSLRDLGNGVPTPPFWFVTPEEARRESTSLAATVEWGLTGGIALDATLFRRRLDDVPRWGLGGGRGLEDVRFDSGVFHGVETSASIAMDRVSLLASYSGQFGTMRAPAFDYAPPWLHRHSVTSGGELRLFEGWVLRAAASWGSGVAQWLPVGQFPVLEFDAREGRLGLGDFVPLRDDEQSRVPAYFRADLRLGRHLQLFGIPTELHVDLINVTNRANVSFYRLALSAADGTATLGQRGLRPVTQFGRLFRVGLYAEVR